MNCRNCFVLEGFCKGGVGDVEAQGVIEPFGLFSKCFQVKSAYLKVFKIFQIALPRSASPSSEYGIALLLTVLCHYRVLFIVNKTIITVLQNEYYFKNSIFYYQ